jgi:hypothetical protein
MYNRISPTGAGPYSGRSVTQARSLYARKRAGADSLVREEVDKVRVCVEAAGEEGGGLRQSIALKVDHVDVGTRPRFRRHGFCLLSCRSVVLVLTTY